MKKVSPSRRKRRLRSLKENPEIRQKEIDKVLNAIKEKDFRVK